MEQGAQLWAWLEEGAHFCVCGDASRMAKDVDTALKQVIQDHGSLSREAAETYVFITAMLSTFANSTNLHRRLGGCTPKA
jgi:hypothetical protein